jgi:hypothetical protein
MDLSTFKLPIDYVPSMSIDTSLITDLELYNTVDPSGTPIYSSVFQPTDELSTLMSKRWTKYTTHVKFLKETQKLRALSKPPSVDEFLQHWKKIHSNSEFKTTFQYIETSKLSFLNYSSTFLCFLSYYLIISPVLLFLSPIMIVVLPFIYLRVKNKELSWCEYTTGLKQCCRTHPIGGLFLNFKDASTQQQVQLIVTALLFCLQSYSTVYTFHTFYKNISYIHSALKCTKTYIQTTMTQMDEVQSMTATMKHHKDFHDTITHHRSILNAFYEKLNSIQLTTCSWSLCKQLGQLRSYFYELRMNTTLYESIQYSFGLYGFIHNMSSIGHLHMCKYSNTTSFKHAYYPIKTPVTNSYTLKKMILTGPNASGKTTFIKQTMINMILSQQIGCGFYKSATITPVETLCCYINIPDTSGRDSLFQAEARRCKEVIELMKTTTSAFCIFDELFSGTNPSEASASAYAFLDYMSKQPHCTFLLTTHFLDVCDKLTKSSIEMYHLNTKDGDELTYTYKLTPGISRIKGGLHILKMLQYPASILQCAKLCG